MPIFSQSETASMDNLDERAALEPYSGESLTVNTRRCSDTDDTTINIGEVSSTDIDLAFRTVGVDVLVRGVTLVSPHTWNLLKQNARSILCESVSALWQHDALHAVVATETDTIDALFLAVMRRGPCATGDIRFNTGMHITEGSFGVVRRESVIVPSLTVSQNLTFAVNLLTRARPEWKREMVSITASFLRLDSHRRAQTLDVGGLFRLKLGMELIRDPPILLLVDPFVGMNETNECDAVDLLRAVAQTLHKTVVVGTCTSSAFHVLNAAATSVLLGCGGRTLYSGPTDGVPNYFNQLHIRAVPHTRGDSDCERLHSKNANSTTHLPVQMQPSASAPYRLSSPLALRDDGTPVAGREYTRVGQEGEGGQNVVHVALPSTAVDLVVEWAESEPQTMLYAAKFYDSRQHTELWETMSRLQADLSVIQAADAWASLPPQTESRKLFVLLRHQLHALRASQEAHAAFAHLLCGLTGLLVLVLQLPSVDRDGAFNERGILFAVLTLPLLANHRYVGGLRGQLALFFNHRHCGLYSTRIFVTTLLLRLIAEHAVHTLTMITFCAWLVPQAPPLFGVAAGLVSLAHRLVLYVSAAVAPTKVDESSTALFYLAYTTFTSGFLMNLTTFPRWMSWGSVLRWGYAAAVKQQADGRAIVCDGPSNTSHCVTSDEYATLLGVTGDSLCRSVYILTGMCAVCVTALGCCLHLSVW